MSFHKLRIGLDWTKSWLTDRDSCYTRPEPEMAACSGCVEEGFVFIDRAEPDQDVISLPDEDSQGIVLCFADASGPSSCFDAQYNSLGEPYSEPLHRKDAHLLNLAGRRDHAHTFKDNRSPAKAYERSRGEREKYFGFRAVKRGDLGLEVCDPDEHRGLPEHRRLMTLTKSAMYERAQTYPRPPTYHRRERTKDGNPWSARATRRRQERKHAFASMTERILDAE